MMPGKVKSPMVSKNDQLEIVQVRARRRGNTLCRVALPDVQLTLSSHLEGLGLRIKVFTEEPFPSVILLVIAIDGGIFGPNSGKFPPRSARSIGFRLVMMDHPD